MPVFLLGQVETPRPMRLANTEGDWKAFYLLFGTHQGSCTVTAPIVFPVKISALMQKEKDASGSSALSLRIGDFSCFSWLSEYLTLPSASWSETRTCLLLPPWRTWLAVTPYLLAPFFRYLLSFFAVPLLGSSWTCSGSWSWTTSCSKVRSDAITLEEQDRRAPLFDWCILIRGLGK